MRKTSKLACIEYTRKDSSGSSSSSISTAAIQSIMEDLKLMRHRDSTRENYYKVWKIFNEFFIRLDCHPESWEDRIILFAGYLIVNRKKSSTINSYISAIKSVLADIGQEVSEDRVLLSSLTRACKLNFDIYHHKLPVRKSMINKFLKSLNSMFSSQPYLRILYQAMISTMYYGLFRIGELTASPHVVKVGDVEIGTNKKKLKFTLHSSKTHSKSNKPQVIKISAMGNSNNNQTCPFQLLRNYLAVRNKYRNKQEQFFIFRDGSAVTAPQFRAVFKKLLELNNYDCSSFTCHGIRGGRTSDLLDMGVSVKTIRKLGRRKSNAVYAYFKS